MNNQVTPGGTGSPAESSTGNIDATFTEKDAHRTALEPEQKESIRSIAETIVRQLCARHNPPNDPSSC